MTQRLTDELWDEAFRTFRRSAWRLEAQGVYREPYEQQPMADFLAGRPVDMSFAEEWLADVRADTGSGKTYRRVRVLTEPLTDYLRFELSFTPQNIAAGEDIRVLPMRRAVDLRIPLEDFWLFDDDRVALMHFAADGFTHADLIVDPAELTRFRAIRDRAWQDAIPFSDYLTCR